MLMAIGIAFICMDMYVGIVVHTKKENCDLNDKVVKHLRIPV